MTLNNSRSLDSRLQYITTLQNGILLAKRETEIYSFYLYSFGYFYVEIGINIENDAEFKVISFIRHRKSRPYLDAIDISSLVS